VEVLSALSRTLPFAFASGINLYATVAVLGLCSRFDLVALPEHFQAFEHPFVITAAVVMYVIEFVADKVPWFDSMWDAAHTVIRPIGGALVAVTTLGASTPEMQVLAGILGGSVATTTHLGKAGTRAAANASPEPFSNWALSFGEDLFVVGLVYVALQHPWLALAVVVAGLAVIIAFAAVLIRAIRRRRQVRWGAGTP
jgi:hypothetical protein